MPVTTIGKAGNFYFEKKWLSYKEAEDNCKEKGGELFKPKYYLAISGKILFINFDPLNYLVGSKAFEKVTNFPNYNKREIDVDGKTFSDYSESFWVSTKNPDENEYCVQMFRPEKRWRGKMLWEIVILFH